MKIFSILFFIYIVFTSCDDKFVIAKSGTVLPDEKLERDDTVLTDSIQKFKFSRLYMPTAHGLIYSYQVPTELSKRDFYIVFDGFARTNSPHSFAYINVNADSEGGVNLSWNGLSLRYYFTDLNKWCYFKDSVYIKHEAWYEPFYKINTYAFTGNSQGENFDIKNLNVQIKIREQ